ncbi:MAG: hypothetical protein ABI725_01180 [Chloroflexota bacterium]
MDSGVRPGLPPGFDVYGDARQISFGDLVIAPRLVQPAFFDAENVAAYHAEEARDARREKCLAKRAWVAGHVADWNRPDNDMPINAVELNAWWNGEWWRSYTVLENGYHRAEWAIANQKPVWVVVYEIRISPAERVPPGRSDQETAAMQKVPWPE